MVCFTLPDCDSYTDSYEMYKGYIGTDVKLQGKLIKFHINTKMGTVVIRIERAICVDSEGTNLLLVSGGPDGRRVAQTHSLHHLVWGSWLSRDREPDEEF